jgi:glycosyltransferase involved in cell wall biosynthesis
VLLVSSQLPGPAAGGQRRRGLELIRRLSARFDLHLLIVSETVGQDLGRAGALRRYCDDIEILAAAPRRHVHDALEPQEPAQVARHHSERATGRVGEILASQAVDLVHVDGFYLMQHIPDWVDVPVLLVEQNVAYDLERRQVSRFGDPQRELRAIRACGLTRETELKCWSRASAIGALTAADRELVRAAVPGADVRLIPDGADHVPHLRALGGSAVTGRPQAPLITLTGDLTCRTEVEAAVHFCEAILPRIREAVPGTQLCVVGDASAPEIQALAGENVRVIGPVTNPVPYIDAADVVVCPSRVAGVARASVSEALRRGKATVSTSLGAQGLCGAAHAGLVIADDEETFAATASSLLADPRRRAQSERAARDAATLLPRWDDAARALTAVYEDLLRGTASIDRSASAQVGAGAGVSA